MFSIDLICHKGSNIHEAIKEAVHIANSAKRTVTFEFNGERMCTVPVDDPSAEIERLSKNYKKRLKDYD